MKKIFLYILVGLILIFNYVNFFNKSLENDIIKFSYVIIYGVNSTQYLRNVISLDYPEVEKSNLNDFEKVNLLRQFVAENLPWASNSLQVKSEIVNKDAPEIFSIIDRDLKEDKGGFDCSGFAYTLMKIYKMYGFESYAYHYGDLKGWNDVVTLVRINYQGKNLLIVQQPLFDAVFINQKTKAPLDFFDFLTKIKSEKTSGIYIQQGGAKPHISFCVKQDNCKIPRSSKMTVISNDKIKYSEKFSTYTLKNNLISFLYARDIQTGDDNDIDGKKQLLDKINNFINND